MFEELVELRNTEDDPITRLNTKMHRFLQRFWVSVFTLRTIVTHLKCCLLDRASDCRKPRSQ